MRVIYEFDPLALTGITDLSGSRKQNALEEIADYVKTEILQYVGDGQSPVEGGKFKRSLSPEYKKIKEEISGVDFANLELRGDMLDALEVRILATGRIQVGYFGGEQAEKADGHNNFSGRSELPAREFIPNESKGQTFKRPIIEGMKQIAESFLED